jgi:hypothetical protein
MNEDAVDGYIFCSALGIMKCAGPFLSLFKLLNIKTNGISYNRYLLNAVLFYTLRQSS